LWPHIFPEEEWYWHIVMMTRAEYEAVPFVDWNIHGTPHWNVIPSNLHPSRKDFTQMSQCGGVWLVLNDRYFGTPGWLGQPLVDPAQPLVPGTFWHEFCEALGTATGTGALDYEIIHYQDRYHCEPLAQPATTGDCPQMDSGCPISGSSPCVRCRAISARYFGLKTNFRQTQKEYDWIRHFFGWRDMYYPSYVDCCAQSQFVLDYDYQTYPLRDHWDHDLAWYWSQPIDSNTGRIHILLERVIGGDGMVEEVINFEDPELIIDPETLVVKEKGFRKVSPNPVARGAPVTAYCYRLAPDGVTEIPREGTTVKVRDAEIGKTGPDGKKTWIAE